MVRLLAQHPQTKIDVRDNFNRQLADMLDYRAEQVVFEAVMAASYPDTWAEIDALVGGNHSSTAGSISGLQYF